MAGSWLEWIDHIYQNSVIFMHEATRSWFDEELIFVCNHASQRVGLWSGTWTFAGELLLGSHREYIKLESVNWNSRLLKGLMRTT